MADDSQDESSKTEEPSQRKLEEARKKGQVVQSREINHFFMMFAFTLIIMAVIPYTMRDALHNLAPFITSPDTVDITSTAFADLSKDVLIQAFLVMLVPTLLLIIAALTPAVIQNKFFFASERIMPKLEKISPMKGFSRIFGFKAFIEFLKNMLKVIVIGAIAYLVVAPQYKYAAVTVDMNISSILETTKSLIVRLLIAVTCFLFFLGALDYFYQRFQFMKSMRMSKQELKDEYKQQEGDPHIKGKRKQIAREKAQKRMMASVPKADVIITNPTHFAVALMYEQGSMQAPKVVAKGVDAVALKIREVAEKHKIPIMRNPPLARILYDTTEVDDEIPYEHYAAVAKIIGYVYKLKGKSMQKPAASKGGTPKMPKIINFPKKGK